MLLSVIALLFCSLLRPGAGASAREPWGSACCYVRATSGPIIHHDVDGSRSRTTGVFRRPTSGCASTTGAGLRRRLN